MATESQHDGERQSDLAVMEANEYKQKRRLERILDAMDGVLDKREEAWQAYVAGEISKEAYNITIQEAVKKAINETVQLLKAYNKNQDGDDRYWDGDDEEPIGTIQVLGESHTITGLKDFHESRQFYEATTVERINRPNQSDEVVRRAVECTVPVDLSISAYIRLKEFLDDVHDLEISFEAVEVDEHADPW